MSSEAMAQEGRADGSAVPPVPDSSQSEPTDTEARLFSAFDGWCVDVYDTFRRFNGVMTSRLLRLRSVAERMDEARDQDPEDRVTNFYSEQIAGAFPGQTIRQQIRDRFEGPFNMFLEKRNLFMAFRAAHGILRSPKYEGSVLAFMLIAIICIVFETAVNGFMYGQASDLGLIGGWGVAAGLSIVIFSSSFIAGWLLTYKNGLVQVVWPPSEEFDRTPMPRWERSVLQRLAVVVGWVLLTAVILVLIAFVCVYRDEAASLDLAAGTHPMAEAISRVASFDLLPRADIEGLLLIFVNLAIMLIGMYKGYTHFDSIPHFKTYAEELARARRELREKIEEAKNELGLSDPQERFGDSLRLYSDSDVENLIHLHNDGVSALTELQRSRDNQIEITVRDCNDRLFAYRNANTEVRPSPYPPPAYFDRRWQPPAAPELARDVTPIDGIDTGAIADTLEQHRSAALALLMAEAQKHYSGEISKYVKESEMHQHEVNQKER